jgi:hypothetical protein
VKPWPKRGDLILFAVLLALSLTGWLTIHLLRSRNAPTSLQIDASEQAFALPLNDTVLVIPGPLGDTKVIIEDGKVWVEEATCPQKICKRQGKIALPGQSIICLPNRIVITIKGDKQPDAVTY